MLAGSLAAAPNEPRVVTVGVLTDNHPFSFAESEGDAPQGFVVDLLAQIERTMSLRIERVVGTTAEINGAFVDGRLDLLQSYAQSDAREGHADFSVPYLVMAGSIFARRGESTIRTLPDLYGRKVLVHRGSLGENLLRAHGLADSIVVVDSVEEAFRQLEAGLGDATLASRLTGMSTIQHLGLRKVVAVGEPIEGYSVRYCFAVRDGDRQLLAQINEGLAVLERTGEYDRIYRAWFGNVDPTRFTALDIALGVSGGLMLALAIALWAMAHQRRLRARIARQAEALRTSEERHRAVFEGSLDGLVVVDGTDAADQTVVQCNPVARKILGAAEDLLLPCAPGRAFPESAALWNRLAESAHATGPVNFELETSHRQQSLWLHVSRARLGDRRWLIVLRDITEARLAAERLRKSEQQSRQTQKLEAIGALASGIAHDFNNILTTISINGDLLRLNLPGDHPAAPHAGEILLAVKRAHALVRQILTFARHADSHRRVLAVTPIVKDTLRFISATAPSSIGISHRVIDRSPLVKIDPAQMHQVIMNLCTNAVHAMGRHPGKLEVTEEPVSIGLANAQDHPSTLPAGDYLLLSVRDTGSGMSPEVLQHIFEPFFTTKPAGEGTGLGLAVVHGIVQACHGAIAVDSRSGEGTTFRLYFPESRQAIEEPSDETPPALVQGRGEVVLVVDDEPAIASGAEKLLCQLGYAVVAASDPEKALVEFERRHDEFAAVITDLTMPRFNGLEFARRIRQIRPRIPIILTSGFIDERDLARAREQRITQVVDKPLSIASLGRALERCLHRHGS